MLGEVGQVEEVMGRLALHSTSSSSLGQHVEVTFTIAQEGEGEAEQWWHPRGIPANLHSGPLGGRRGGRAPNCDEACADLRRCWAQLPSLRGAPLPEVGFSGCPRVGGPRFQWWLLIQMMKTWAKGFQSPGVMALAGVLASSLARGSQTRFLEVRLGVFLHSGCAHLSGGLTF